MATTSLRLSSRATTLPGGTRTTDPTRSRARADVVNLGYVVNVIEDPIERTSTVRRAPGSSQATLLVVSARLEDERDLAHVAPLRDGWITRRGTFQKFYAHDELGAWIEQALGEQTVAAGLGVVLRLPQMQPAREPTSLPGSVDRSSLPRRRSSDAAFEEHRDVLQPLIDFVATRGRLPHESEIEAASRACGRVRFAAPRLPSGSVGHG